MATKLSEMLCFAWAGDYECLKQFVGENLRGDFLQNTHCSLKTNQIARIETRIYKMAGCFFRRVFLMHFTWE